MIVDPDTCVRLPELSATKRGLLEKRLRGGLKTRTATAAIPRRVPAEHAPLSFAQQRLWFSYQLAPERPLYNISVALRLQGRLDCVALEKSLAAIVARHESLRTRYVCVGDEPFQVIDGSPAVRLAVVDLKAVSEDQRDAEIERLLREEASRPFNLSRDLMLRAVLARFGATDQILYLTLHHIAADGWSLGVLFNELGELYKAYVDGRPPALLELPIQYADFAIWQRERMQRDVLHRELAYWKRQLAGAPDFLELPADRPRPAVQSFRGRWQWTTFPKPLCDAAKAFSQREGVTLFMMLLATFQTLLHRYTGKADILVGSPIAGRTRIETERLIGFFINTLVLRGNFSGHPTVRELLRRVREMTLDAYAHQDLPFEKLVDQLRPERSSSHSPLIQVLFLMQNAPAWPLSLPGLTVTPIPATKVDNGTAKLDLTLQTEDSEEGLRVGLEYNSDLFEEATMARLLGHFQTLLEGIVAKPNERVSELPLLTTVERKQLLVDWNNTRRDFSQDKTIPELFKEQAATRPDAVAATFEERHLTYRELDRRADQFAAFLQKQGVGPELPVGICMDRSLRMLVALLGILKAGGAYVPLDPAYPGERLALVLSDAGVKAIVTETEQLKTVAAVGLAQTSPGACRIICIDDWLKSAPAAVGDGSVVAAVRPENLAYVIYTSGSTGKPKGVQIEHRSVVNFLESVARVPGIDSDDVLLAVTTLSFDIAALELFLPLVRGGRVILAGRETASDGHLLARLLDDCGATVLQATPATWRMLLDAGWKGRAGLKLLCGGESWNHELAERLLPRCGSLWNMYGPTETTIWSAATRVASGKPVRIADPIANTSIYIVDDLLQPVPIGIPGELCIGGEGVARGYWNRPDLTSEKFIANPFSSEPGARLYKTGDLARFRSDGRIEFLGRKDQQVKLRGFRIELEEVETALSKHPAVRQAVASVRENGSGEKSLLAYFVPASHDVPTSADMRRWLSERLPGYMIPSTFVVLETMPLTPNGKVDRKRLPVPPAGNVELNGPPVAPRDMLEQQLTKILEEVLHVRPVGLSDNFFDLGGDSLVAVRLFSEIRRLTRRELPLSTLFQAPTVGQLAEILRQDGWSPRWSSLVPIQPGRGKAPFYCIHGGGGHVLFYRDLARHLGSDYPFYGLQSQGLHGSENRLTRVEDMASHYLKEIRELQPVGPYYLGGFCMGGSVALEMAQQLAGDSQSVALLAFFDSYNHNGAVPRRSLPNRIVYRVQKFEFHLRNLLQLAPKHWSLYLADKLKGARERELARLSLALSNLRRRIRVGSGTNNIEAFLEDVNDRAGIAYQPQAYHGKITLFQPRKNYNFRRRQQMSWECVAQGGLDVVELPVYPGGMFVEPFVQTLASRLRAALDAAQASG